MSRPFWWWAFVADGSRKRKCPGENISLNEGAFCFSIADTIINYNGNDGVTSCLQTSYNYIVYSHNLNTDTKHFNKDSSFGIKSGKLVGTFSTASQNEPDRKRCVVMQCCNFGFQ